MRRVDAFYLFPAVCASCGTTSGGGVDLERDVEGFRPDKPYRLYLCESCVTELANQLGFVTPADHRDAAVARDAALSELELHRERANVSAELLKQLGQIGWLDRCGVCDWTGKSIAHHARYCKLDQCPHRKTADTTKPDTEKADVS